MAPVVVRILHPEPGPAAGPLERLVADARSRVAEAHGAGFLAAGADDVSIVAGPPDDTPFGARLRRLADRDRPGGIVVLGSGAIPLATAADRRDFVVAARGPGRRALANNRYSADVIAVAEACTLTEVPDLAGDNALPRWLAEVAGYEVTDLARRWRLAIDIDGPLELLLIGGVGGRSARWNEAPDPIDAGLVLERLGRVEAVAADRRAELLVAGRTSAATLGWLERHAACRVRALVEERGLRASTRLALGPDPSTGGRPATGRPATARARPPANHARPPASVLGALLDRDGPTSLGVHLARLADAAVVDSRVLLAHRLGADESRWPVAEDRFASDLLLPDRIVDPWLRELTAAAVGASIPIVLGGHTLVGPGVRLVVRRRPGARR